MRVAVIGGGLGGLATAGFLLRAGCTSTDAEAAARGSGVGSATGQASSWTNRPMAEYFSWLLLRQ